MTFSKGYGISVTIVALLSIIGFVVSIFQKDKCGENTASSDVVLENIATRTSVRQYTDKEVSNEMVEKILKAGMAAPTAVNRQPWAFIVVNDPKLLKELADSLPHAKMTAQASVAIVACGDSTKMLNGDAAEFWVQDVSAATENILLAAHALGLGAVWTGVYPNMDRAEAVRKILSLPSKFVPLDVIPIGYPAENPTPKDKWKPQNIYYNAMSQNNSVK